MIDLTTKEVDNMIEWLAGYNDHGPGMNRKLYSKSWVEAQHALKERFEALGMQVEFDRVGNLFATLEGTENPDAIIAAGSHVDTVGNGGKFDGALGIIAAYLSVKKLVETHGQPKKSLRIISMAEEEGSRFPYAFWGSKNIFGEADIKDVEGTTDGDGIKFEDAMREAGFEFPDGEVKFNEMDAWLELHIEQGNFLELEGQQVGVVDAIAGQKRYTVTLKGEANHAGTTLMRYRRDTVEALSHIVTSSLDKAKAIGDPLVLTFGRVDVTPNVVNVVPGEVAFSIDCRHTDQEALDSFTDELETDMKEIASSMNIEIDIDQWMDEPPVPMDEDICQLLVEVCEDNDLNYRQMHSGAGHDTQIFAPHVPSAMFFVPSVNGISHNPDEYTATEDIIPGVQALAEALRRLAYE